MVAKNPDLWRLVFRGLDKAVLVERFLKTCPDFLAAARLKELATNNWRIIYGQDLPSTL